MRERIINLILDYEGRLCTGCGRYLPDESAERIADHLIDNGVTFADVVNGGKKAVCYSTTRGALCPACDMNLDFKITFKKFFREKSVMVRHKTNYCMNCGQALYWGDDNG